VMLGKCVQGLASSQQRRSSPSAPSGSRFREFFPGLRIDSDNRLGSFAYYGSPEKQGFLQEFFLNIMLDVLKVQLLIQATFCIDQILQGDASIHGSQFPLAHAFFRQIDELEGNPAFLEEAFRLLAAVAFFRAENLNEGHGGRVLEVRFPVKKNPLPPCLREDMLSYDSRARMFIYFHFVVFLPRARGNANG